jgi:hypothetical protein
VGPEWDRVPVSYFDHEVKKLDDLIFFACPLSTITPESWELIRMVNLYTNAAGEVGPHLPEPHLPLHDQSPKFLEAVRLVRQERNSQWFRGLQEKWAKEKG